MTNDNKPPMLAPLPWMFGPSAVFDPATHEFRSGKSVLMGEMLAALVAKPPALADLPGDEVPDDSHTQSGFGRHTCKNGSQDWN
ncbi:hypothetical protein RN20_13120 [Xanthomonas phaseoli pv. phaseoli]|uniref:Uncharacterized protein n=1 Tax=Xanthomonas campestris pv. phaseoli TaxID=317013 RepID=A0AB34QHM1_XANCH|nr:MULTISPECIES: hypothetical protein [Xanthomonas]ATS91172.1 hypothetical protein XcfCFBP6167P_23875 [Xanthomonas citri pv. phaseoli var. fuscans]KHS36666.1 hypothetical protein RN20_13120 [Xanthomonas phaseoli pv. phaseoli]TBW92911.1 hypothetical protein TP49_23805 [Xanthomonas citri pv. aurantifolii]